ncbi:MAG: hypothetical protein HFG59_00005 [Lachnospiraceae bacterium]|nr:hypothetical protein [Lachnospiraceae bacterium]
MKHRFETQKPSSTSKNFMISIGCFALIVFLFTAGTSLVSDKTDAQEIQTLEQAVNRGIVHCYSMEGSYPASLQYLKDHYGLTYDDERFFVDYQTLGSNIMPDVTIIDRRGR